MLLFPTGVSGATDSSSMLLAISWRISSVIDSARDRGREPSDGARDAGRDPSDRSEGARIMDAVEDGEGLPAEGHEVLGHDLEEVDRPDELRGVLEMRTTESDAMALQGDRVGLGEALH